MTSKVYPLFGKIEAYYRSVARFELAKNIPAFEKKFEDSLAAFKFAKKNA